MAVEEDVTQAVTGTWILGVSGISLLALFLGCVSCCQKKSSVPPARSPAPPIPPSEQTPRYETGPFASPPVPAGVPRVSEIPNSRIEPPTSTIGRNSAEPRISTTDTNSHSSYVNISKLPSYENVANCTLGAPEARRDHMYLEIIAADALVNEPETCVVQAANEMRRSVRARTNTHPVTSQAKSLSEGHYHMYGNVVLDASQASLELDYVNVPECLTTDNADV